MEDWYTGKRILAVWSGLTIRQSASAETTGRDSIAQKWGAMGR